MQSRYPSASVHPYHILRPVRSSKRWIYPGKQQEGGPLHYPGQWQGVIPVPEKTGGVVFCAATLKGYHCRELNSRTSGKCKKKAQIL